MYDLTINTSSVSESATKITSIVAGVRNSIDTLNKLVENLTSNDLQLDWANRLVSDWKSYNITNVEAALAIMSSDAETLQKAVAAYIKYAQENGNEIKVG